MALQITLVKTPAKVSVSKTSQIFKKQGGTLGRADSNVWVLPDPDKFLSSCHCEILFDSVGYYILDLSTNGTFFNNALEPLGKGTKAPLNDGDFFDMGEYRFSVKVVADQDFGNSSPFGSKQTSPAPMHNDDIFGGSGAVDSSFADSFSGNGFLPSDFSLGTDSQNTDPLLALDNAHRIPSNNNFDAGGLFGSVDQAMHNQPMSNQPMSNQPISNQYVPHQNNFMGHAQTDHTPSIDQAISWPTSAQENLIPDDWDVDLMAPSPVHSPLPINVVTHAKPVTTNPFMQEHLPSINEFPTKKSQQPIAASMPAPTFTPAQIPVVNIAPAVNIAPRVNIVPAVNIVPTVNVAPQVVSAVNSNGSNNRLIAAMGLDVNQFTPEQAGEVSDIVGELMREIVDGMMQVLRSRTSIKNEFRMNVTTIQPVENNPLKFSVGVDEALETMFIKKTNAYKKPVDAFREGFQEIGEHQVAMIAGIRFGFDRMVERFNPDNLEKNFDKHGKGGILPGMQKAKYWNNYKEYYGGFLDNMESSFQHLFGSDFVNAYEDQLRKLSAARKKNR